MTLKQTRISIKDVAERAGVSKCTVSKVLNGKSARITDATREHVQSIARELGYEPNHFARLLGKNDTRIIGVLIHNITNPIYARAVEVLEETLYHHGYQALFEVPGIAVAEDIEQRGSKLRGWPVDGFLFWCSREFDIAFFHGTAAKEIPSLYLEVAPPDEKPCILLDLYGGGVLAAKHLLENGYVAVAHVAFGIGEAEERTRGFVDTMREAGQEVEIIAVSWDEQTREKGLEIGTLLANRPVEQRPRAIFCHNDLLAIGVHRGLRRAGLRVPEDVAIIGFDGIEEGRYLEQPLTTVTWSVEEMCRVAVERLLGEISGTKISDTENVTRLPMHVFSGGTT